MAQPTLLKVWSSDRTIRKAVSSSNFAEFKEKCKTKFNLSDNEMKTVRFVLEEDGTEVDEDYYEAIQIWKIILLLKQNEIWAPDSEEKRLNFFRQLLLCQDLGTTALRIVFDGKVPSLYVHLKYHKKDLTTSKWKCSPPQMALLFPVNTSTVVKTTDFDFSLLYKLIRNTVNISAPGQGWGNDPTPADITISDDIERVRYYRNKISHNTEFQIDHNNFNSQWTELSQAIERMSSGALTYEIKILRNQNLDNTSMNRVFDELKKELRNVTKKLEEDRSNPIRQNVREQHRRTIEQWRSDDLLYNETTYYKLVYDTIKEQKYLTLIGGPGMGKTSTIRHIALQLEEEGYYIVPISDLSDTIQYGQVDAKQVFVVDDIFGIFGLQIDRCNSAGCYREQIFNLLGDASKLLITCRKSVHNDVLKYDCFITNPTNVVDLEGEGNQLSDDDKKGILAKHCWKSDVQKEIYENICFDYPTVMFPLLCKLFANDKNYHNLGNYFFRNPYKSILDEISKLQTHNALHYASLVMCALNQNSLSEEIVESPTSEIVELKKNVFRKCEVRSSTDSWEIINALSREKGTYTTKLGNKFTLLHDFIFEVIACHYGRKHPDHILKYMPCSFICKRVSVNKQKDSYDDLTIYIPESHFHVLAARLYKDVGDMNLHDVFTNTCLYSERLCDSFIQVLNNNPYQEIKSMFLLQHKMKDKMQDKMEKIIEKSVNEQRTFKDWIFYKQMQDLLIDKSTSRYMKGQGDFIRIRAMSWVVMYGHAKILRSLIERVNNSHDSTDLVFGSDTIEQTRILILGCYSNNVNLVQLIISHVRRECLDSTASYFYDVFGDDDHRNYTPLTAACEVRFCDIVTKLIESQCDINMGDKRGYTPITTACKRGHCDIVTKLIESQCDINKADERGYTPITTACESGHCDIFTKLIESQCDINMADKRGYTPITAACRSGCCDIVTNLIESQCDMNKADEFGFTPITIACELRNCDIVTKLIESQCDINRADKRGFTPITTACRSGYCDIVTKLIESGCDINKTDELGFTPMTTACEWGHCEIITLLIESCCDIDKADNHGLTPITAICKSGHFDIFTKSIKDQCDIHEIDRQGRTLLWWGSYSGNTSFVGFLIKHKVDGNRCDNDNRSPLYIASERGNGDMVRLLIEHGADVTICDKDNKSPLYAHVASDHTRSDVVSLLIKHGADVTICDKDNKSPLYAHVASDHPSSDVVSLLIKHGADVTICDKDNKSPLYAHVASDHPSSDVVSLLIQHGADVTICDKDNKSPLYAHVASDHTRSDVVSLLIKHGADVTICDKDNKSPLYAHVASDHPSSDVVSLLIKHGADVNLCDKENKSPLYAHLTSNEPNADVISLLITQGADVNLCDKDNKSPLHVYVMSKRANMKIVHLLVLYRADLMSLLDTFDNYALINTLNWPNMECKCLGR